MKNIFAIACVCGLLMGCVTQGVDRLQELNTSLNQDGVSYFYGADVVNLLDSTNAPVKALLGEAISAEEAASVGRSLYHRQQVELKKNFGAQWGEKVLRLGDLKMPFDLRLFGEKPEDGRSLYISMHGGGSAPAALNSQQWMNQIQLYRPAEGVYIAPRAPFDDWNMWFRPEMTYFFDRLIQLAVIELDVNPNKVYLMGYSAGGDGVFRMAPRLADRWAATAMMAGHPGDVTPLNLRNIGFTLWAGGKDAAYDRNKKAAEFEAKLAEVKKNDPEGYPYEVHILAEKGHWMDLEDAAAVPWMAKFTRNPLPEKIAWRQEEAEALEPSFYWLSIPIEKAEKGSTVVVERKGNTFIIEECSYPTLTIWVNDAMINFAQPVEVVYKGKVIEKTTLTRSVANLYESLKMREDPGYIFSGKIIVKTNE